MNYFEDLLARHAALSRALPATPVPVAQAQPAAPLPATAPSADELHTTLLQTIVVPQTPAQTDPAQLSRAFERDARRYG